MAYTKGKNQIKQSETIRKQREDLVNKIIEDMKRDGLRWSEPYLPNLSPRNPVTGTVYKGANRFYLALDAMQRGFTDPRWCTFQQAKKQNWSIRKGAEAARIERWKEFSVKEEAQDGIDGDDEEEIVTTRLALVGYWNVFNAEEIEGIPPLPDLHEHDRTAEIADDLIMSSRCEVKEDAHYIGMAGYSPASDHILIGPRSTFVSDESFTRTLLHEMTHSTGHSDALGRSLDTTFGSAEYAKEELVAELGSLFMSADLGIQSADMEGAFYENHVSYLKSWIRHLEDDPNYLFKAASLADKASSYLKDAYDATLERKQADIGLSIEEVREAHGKDVRAVSSLAERCNGVREASKGLDTSSSKEEQDHDTNIR